MYQQKTLTFVANTGTLHAPMLKAKVAAPGGVSVKAHDHFTTELMYVTDGFTLPGWASPLMGNVDMIDLRTLLFTLPGGISMLTAATSMSGSRNYPPAVASCRRHPFVRHFPTPAWGARSGKWRN